MALGLDPRHLAGLLRAPAGTGEIAPLDNRTVLHASYDPRPKQKGYPIAVRYLF